MWNDLSLNGFLLVSYFRIVKEGLEKYISYQRKLLRLISLHAGLQGNIKARTIGLHSAPTGLRLLWCRIMLTAGPVTVPHVPGTGMRAAVRFILPFVRTRISFNFFISVPHSPFLSLPHSSSWAPGEREREREDRKLQVSGVCSSTVCDAIMSISPSFEGSFVPFYNNRTHWFEYILVFSSAITKNLADDPYRGRW